ncbi:MAG: hypothetical protein KGZ58_01390 [Ignavibacteriales bacterium]|nr:hypothetical protein [Ignavibacteriales bacterium]
MKKILTLSNSHINDNTTNNNVSYPRTLVSIMQKRKWIPAFAGMTMWGMFIFSFFIFIVTMSGVEGSFLIAQEYTSEANTVLIFPNYL